MTYLMLRIKHGCLACVYKFVVRRIHRLEVKDIVLRLGIMEGIEVGEGDNLHQVQASPWLHVALSKVDAVGLAQQPQAG